MYFEYFLLIYQIDAKCTAENGEASLDGLRVSTQPVCIHIFLLLGLSLFVGQ